MTKSCQSCGMEIPDSRFCHYCVGGDGALRPINEQIERLIALRLKHDPDISAVDAEQEVLARLARQPAWRDDPDLPDRPRIARQSATG